MTNEIMIAGFGGQGRHGHRQDSGRGRDERGQGRILAALLRSGNAGGTANCCVVISSEPIICPIVLEPTELIAMNLPSLFEV